MTVADNTVLKRWIGVTFSRSSNVNARGRMGSIGRFPRERAPGPAIRCRRGWTVASAAEDARTPACYDSWFKPLRELHTVAEDLVIHGARTHNLKNVDVSLPVGKLIIITGVSGSGKSSLAFDTIYAEGQRRYVESLSAYARQFLERMEKPDVDRIDGISPAIAIRQKNSIRNPRSTVGTTTEIHDYMRLLYARIGRRLARRAGRGGGGCVGSGWPAVAGYLLDGPR